MWLMNYDETAGKNSLKRGKVLCHHKLLLPDSTKVRVPDQAVGNQRQNI